MSAPIVVVIPGPPQGKGRARAFATKAGKIGHYTPGPTRTYEGIVRTLAMEQMCGRPALEGAVEVVLVALFPVPKSFSKAQAAAAISGQLRPAKRPDIDNIAKAILDGARDVIFNDDRQIVDLRQSKFYGAAPQVVLTVREVSTAPRRKNGVDGPPF